MKSFRFLRAGTRRIYYWCESVLKKANGWPSENSLQQNRIQFPAHGPQFHSQFPTFSSSSSSASGCTSTCSFFRAAAAFPRSRRPPPSTAPRRRRSPSRVGWAQSSLVAVARKTGVCLRNWTTSADKAQSAGQYCLLRGAINRRVALLIREQGLQVHADDDEEPDVVLGEH